MLKSISVVCLIVAVTSIGIPLNPMISRCMIAYTDDNYQTLKLDVKFPTLPEQVNGQVYQIEIYNTETHQTLFETIPNGRYRKQMDLDQNAVYRFCFKLLTNRQIGTIVIDYNSDVEYYQTKKSIKVPQNLLKSQQTKFAYQKILSMQQSIDRYQDFSQRKKQQQNQHYLETVKVNSRLATISYIEIAIVLLAGIYQFFTIRKFLVDKQYM